MLRATNWLIRTSSVLEPMRRFGVIESAYVRLRAVRHILSATVASAVVFVRAKVLALVDAVLFAQVSSH